MFSWIKHEIDGKRRRASGEPMQVLDDYAPTDIDSFVELMRGSGYRAWGVEVDGDVVGFASFSLTNQRAGICWFLFRPRFLSIAPEAISGVLAELFAGGKIERVAFLPFTDNGWSQALLKRLGAVREGTLRDSTLRGGKPASQAVLAILKTEVKYASIPSAVGDCGSERVGKLPGQPEANQQVHAEHE